MAREQAPLAGGGAPLLVAALIIGASLVAGSLLIRSAVDDAAHEVAALREAIQGAGVPSAPAAPTAERPERPDPSRRYAVSTQGSPIRGSEDAKLAIVEFSDFQCPYCGRVRPTLDRIEQEYGDRVRIVFKHLPLRMHPKAPAAHAAAEAAHRQGKFWEMHDRIFANQREMSPEKYVEYAADLGLDVARFKRDVASAEVQKRIDADKAEAARLGVSGTPAFFVNGRFISGARPYETFQAMIDRELGTG